MDVLLAGMGGLCCRVIATTACPPGRVFDLSSCLRAVLVDECAEMHWLDQLLLIDCNIQINFKDKNILMKT